MLSFPNKLISSNYHFTIFDRCIASRRLPIIRIFRTIAFCACLFFIYSTAVSETKQLASSGDWALIRSDITAFGMGQGVAIFKDACTARTGDDSDFFSVTIGPGVTFLNIRRSLWDWPRQERDVNVVIGNAAVLFQDAIHGGNFIQFGMASKNGVNPLVQKLARQPGKIKVFDHRDKLIARFSSRGFMAMLNKTIQCNKERLGLEKY